MPGVLDPYRSLFLKAPPEYQNCDNVAPSDVIWKTIDDHLGYRIWKSCTYNSRTDYGISGGGNYTIQDWNNPNPGQDTTSDCDFTDRLANWQEYSVPWPLAANRWYHNQLVPPMWSCATKDRTFWHPETGRALAATASITLTSQKMILFTLF